MDSVCCCCENVVTTRDVCTTHCFYSIHACIIYTNASSSVRKKKAEVKRAAALEAAAKRKRDAEAKMNARKAAESLANAKPGFTISLSGIFPVQDNAAPGPKNKKASPKPRVLSSSPRGVPTLSKWRQNRNGSISAYIFGSSNFSEGETITTSQITTDAVPGAVVETSSGSKYFLDPGLDKALKDFQAKKRQEAQAAATKAVNEKRRLAEHKRKELEAKRAAAGNAKRAEQLAPAAKPGASISLFGLGGGQPPKRDDTAAKNAKKAQQMVAKAKAGATIPLFGGPSTPKKEVANKSALAKTASSGGAKPRSTTISLFGFGGQQQQQESKKNVTNKPAAAAAAAKAPNGVPSIVRWRRNFDGSLTGFIFGSISFAEGEKITTSPIKKGIELISGATVETASGSKYFLV